MVWQPLRSVEHANAATTALGQGDGTRALTDAQAAASEDPVAWQPLWYLSEIYSAFRNERQARTELLAGVNRQPDNAQTWYQLGEFELNHGQARAALAALQRAHQLDLADPQTNAMLAQARLASGAARSAGPGIEVFAARLIESGTQIRWVTSGLIPCRSACGHQTSDHMNIVGSLPMHAQVPPR
jgi:tetratricopeptide (TPR) repeat protein